MSMESSPYRYYPEVTPSEVPYVATPRDLFEHAQRAAWLRTSVVATTKASKAEAPSERPQRLALAGGIGYAAIDAAASSTARFGNGISDIAFTLFNDGQTLAPSANVLPLHQRSLQRAAGELLLAAA